MNNVEGENVGVVGNEDKNGFINLNVRVHRNDILDAMGERAVQKKINRKLFKRMCQRMANFEPFIRGNLFNGACRDAYESVLDYGSE